MDLEYAMSGSSTDPGEIEYKSSAAATENTEHATQNSIIVWARYPIKNSPENGLVAEWSLVFDMLCILHAWIMHDRRRSQVAMIH
jgi:hypothetical protein